MWSIVCEIMTQALLRENRSSALPKIVISLDDYETLSNLAHSAGGDLEYAADLLLQELQRARVVSSEKLDKGIVRIGSWVSYRIGGGTERKVQLVVPYMADISSGRISVLTPVGAALIGLCAGQTIRFATADGRSQVVQVLEVLQEDGQ